MYSVLVIGFGEQYLTQGLVTSDAVAPAYTVTPFASSILDTSIQTRTTIAEISFPSTFYVVALADGAGAPTAAQIRAGTDSSDSAAPNSSTVFSSNGAVVTANIGGLSAETAYDVYYTARDAFGNDSTPAKIDVTTGAASVTTILAESSDLVRDVISQGIATNLSA